MAACGLLEILLWAGDSLVKILHQVKNTAHWDDKSNFNSIYKENMQKKIPVGVAKFAINSDK